MPGPDALDWLSVTEPDPVREVIGESAVLRAATLDGVVVEVWTGVLRAVDLGVTPADRARSVGAAVPVRAAVARRSALWVHTGVSRPTVLEVVGPGRRSSTARARVHAEILGPGDVVLVGGVAVTSPERTAVDLARWGPEPAVHGWVAALRAFGLRGDVVEALLNDAAGHPGVVRARRLLEPAPAVSACRAGAPGRAAASTARPPASPGAPRP